MERCNLFSLILFICTFSLSISAQENIGYPFTGWALGENGACNNSQVDVEVYFVDLLDQDKEVYRETHSTTSNELGKYQINVSTGTVKNGIFETKFLTDYRRYKMRVSLKVNCNGTIVERSDVGVTTPVVPVAENANEWGGKPAPDAEDDVTVKDLMGASLPTLGNHIYIIEQDSPKTKRIDYREFLEEVTPEKLCEHVGTDPMDPKEIPEFLKARSEEKLMALDLFGHRYALGKDGIIKVNDYPEKVEVNYDWFNLNQNNYIWDILQPTLPWQNENFLLYHGDDPDNAESKVTYNIPKIGKLNHGFEIKISDSESPDHNTAAGFFSNLQGTTGILSEGLNYGGYFQGSNGVIGIAQNPNTTGGSVWGFVPQKPIKEQFTIALLGDANNITSSEGVFGLGVYGDGFVTGGLVVGSLSETSDARLKESIQPADAALENVLKLQPKEYQFIKNTGFDLPEGDQIGFLAQDLEKIYPQLIREVTFPTASDPSHPTAHTETNTYKTVNYSALIPILTKAIQELNEKLEEQAKAIEMLNKTIDELKSN
ncbi:MAG: tail fiber domain-containing protein [Saprospiraceae bacterium]